MPSQRILNLLLKGQVNNAPVNTKWPQETELRAKECDS